MPEFIQVAKVTDMPDPGKMLVEADGRLIVLFRVGASFTRSTTFAPTTAARWAKENWTLKHAPLPARATAQSSTSQAARP